MTDRRDHALRATIANDGKRQGSDLGRWQQGQSLRAIGHALDRNPASVFHVVATGWRPTRGALTLASGATGRRAGGDLAWARDRPLIPTNQRADRPCPVDSEPRSRPAGRSPVVPCRSGGRRHMDRALRPQRCRLAQYPVLCARVAEKLAIDWSPQQIVGWLKRTYPRDPDMQVSHETIYLSLFVQRRGVLKKSLSGTSGVDGPCVARSMRPQRDSHGDRSWTGCRFASAWRASRIAPCPVTRRATCSQARRIRA